MAGAAGSAVGPTRAAPPRERHAQRWHGRRRGVVAAARHGRQAQVWALDEIANVIRCHPILAAAKNAFPDAQVVSVRPSRAALDQLNDELSDIPF